MWTYSHYIIIMWFAEWRLEKGTTEDEIVGWHHWLDGHEFEQAPGVGDGQGSLECRTPWGHKESDTTERLNQTELNWVFTIYKIDCLFLPIKISLKYFNN